MPEKQRKKLLQSIGASTGDAQKDRANAEKYVDENIGKFALARGIRTRAVEDVLRADRGAIRAWLEHGSKEDWRAHVGVLRLPAIVFAGTEDEALGPDAQREYTLPHLVEAELVTLAGSGHLAPLERAGELVLRIAAFAVSAGVPADRTKTELGRPFAALIASDFTAPQTRAVLEARLGATGNAHAPEKDSPRAFDREQFFTLQALVECVIPHAPFDLAARLDDALGDGPGDGWRFAELPADAEAWRTGLRSLDAAAHHAHGFPFIACGAPQQTALLEKARAGELGKTVLDSLHLGSTPPLFSAKAMQQWFEDVRGELTRLYVADPRTLELIGFTGFADDGGFTQIRLGEREEFEA